MLDILQKLRLQSLYGGQFPSDGDTMMGVDPSMMTDPSLPPMLPQDGNNIMGVDFSSIPQGYDNPNQPQLNQPNQPPSNDINGWLKELYNPEHAQQTRLTNLMDSYPQEPNPSKGRRIGGAMVGALADIGRMYGGVGNGKAAFDEITGKTKYRENIQDWQNKIAPAERAATLEKQSNTNERTMAMQTIADKLRQEAQAHKEANDEINAKIRQQRADVYEFKAKNPGMKLVVTKGGNVQAMDPITGELHDTGIPTGSLSDADKAALTHDYTSQEIDQRGGIQKDIVGLRHDNTDEEIDRRGSQARDTKATPSGNLTGANKPELPSQTRIRQFNKARELYNSRPDLRPFITLGTNDFKVTAPSKSMFGGAKGPNDKQYKEINDSIYGATGNLAPIPSHGGGDTSVLPSPGQGNKGVVNNPQSAVAPKAPAGWKYVPKPGGGWTAVRDNGGL
jgi:hypothetical protein